MSIKNKIFTKAKELHLKLNEEKINQLDEAQLREVCVGLYYGVDVTKFSFPCIPAENMRQLRLMEISGFDCTPYRIHYNSMQLEQIYLGMISQIDYTLYDKIPVDAENMRILREDLTARLTNKLKVSYYEAIAN